MTSPERPWAWVVWSGLMAVLDDDDKVFELMLRCLNDRVDFHLPADEALALILEQLYDRYTDLLPNTEVGAGQLDQLRREYA